MKMKPPKLLTTVVAALLLGHVAAFAGTAVHVDPVAGGINYYWTVNLGPNDTATMARSVGAWSWEDQTLFQPGQTPVGWTHNSEWVALKLKVGTLVTIRLENKADYATGSPAQPFALPDLIPGVTIYSGWDNDPVPQEIADQFSMDGPGIETANLHFFVNRGDTAWMEDTKYFTHLEPNGTHVVEKTIFMPAGEYSVVLGGNAASVDQPGKQGYQLTFTTGDAVPTPSVLAGPVVKGIAMGAPAPGAGTLPGLPEGATLSAFSTPAVSDSHDTAARVKVLADRKLLDGIYQEDGSSVGKLVAYQNGPAPGILTSGVTFKSFLDPVLSPSGSIAFSAKLQGGKIKTTEDEGVWSDAFGAALELVLREGVDVPGLPVGAKLKAVTSISLRDGELLARVTLSSAKGVVTAGKDDTALVRLTGPNEGNLLLRTGAVLGDSTIKTISVLQPAVGSLGSGRWHGAGAVTAKVTLANKKIAVVAIAADGSAITPLLLTATAATGVDASTVWTNFGLPAIGTDGNGFVVAGTLKPGKPGTVTTITDAVLLFSNDGVAFTPFVRESGDTGLPPAVAGAATPQFATFLDPLVNDAGKVAFLATLKGKGITATNKSTLWWGSPEVPALVAQTGTLAHNELGEEIAGAVLKAILSHALPSGSGVGPVFLGSLSGKAPVVTTKNNTGLWAVDSAGTVRLLLRTGDSVEIDGAPKIVAAIKLLDSLPGSFGVARSYNAAGTLAALTTFVDKSQTLLRIDIP